MTASPLPFIPPAPGFVAKEETATEATPMTPKVVMPPVPSKPAKKDIPVTENKVIGAKILLTYKGADGQLYTAETVVEQSDYKIQTYALAVEEKHEKKRDPETKDIIGFEDTGERVLTFKLRYHVR